jgi:glutamyl/glutaminyl-tRNA synthetase
MRGEEWLSSTPKHVVLYQFFDWKLPKFIHLPLLLNPDKSKLSKRQGDVGVEDYLNKGFLPETLINFVALLGWHPQNEQEIFSLNELEREFSIKRIQKSGAVFDSGKLEWMNSQYLMNMDLGTIAKLAKPYYTNQEMDISDKIKYLQVVDNARRRTNSLFEMPGESQMFYDSLDISIENLDLVNSETSQKLLKTIHAFLTNEADCDGDRFKSIVIEVGDEYGVNGKDLFFPVRIALYGDPKGPDIPLIFSILGRDETLIRLFQVIK